MDGTQGVVVDAVFKVFFGWRRAGVGTAVETVFTLTVFLAPPETRVLKHWLGGAAAIGLQTGVDFSLGRHWTSKLLGVWNF